MANSAASIILTWRSNQLDEEHIGYLEHHYRNIDGCEWILVEQRSQIGEGVAREAVQSGQRHLRVSNPSTLNCAWGWNVGASAAQGAVLIFLTPWTLVSRLAITKAASVCQGRAGAANLFSSFVSLSEVESARLVASRNLPDFSIDQGRTAPSFGFGGFAIHAGLFRKLGGFDERLAEETASLRLLTDKLSRANAPLASFDNSLAYRLAGQTPNSPETSTLLETLRDEYRRQDGNAFHFANEVRRQLSGNRVKYAQNAVTP